MKGRYNPDETNYYMFSKQRFGAALKKQCSVRQLPSENRYVKEYQLLMDGDERKAMIHIGNLDSELQLYCRTKKWVVMATIGFGDDPFPNLGGLHSPGRRTPPNRARSRSPSLMRDLDFLDNLNFDSFLQNPPSNGNRGRSSPVLPELDVNSSDFVDHVQSPGRRTPSHGNRGRSSPVLPELDVNSSDFADHVQSPGRRTPAEGTRVSPNAFDHLDFDSVEFDRPLRVDIPDATVRAIHIPDPAVELNAIHNPDPFVESRPDSPEPPGIPRNTGRRRPGPRNRHLRWSGDRQTLEYNLGDQRIQFHNEEGEFATQKLPKRPCRLLLSHCSKNHPVRRDRPRNTVIRLRRRRL
ncbi:hypothetical protein JTE90_020615 [Oedothorax gibbosus]|uniref:IRF tryptophan pentad repeat domain-containing protein n=1 Tax=Oedothorax gibbosus TaxID=931172 RepID=A0AAV6TS63_9ARAC|nr:hypothetical protein JTE90_020615 [Oedothorax gibbosus]